MSVLTREDVHLLDYLRVIYKRRVFFAVVLLAAFVGTYWSTSRQTPIYQAKARILVDNEATIVDFRGVRQFSRAALSTEVHLARSQEVAENAVRKTIAPSELSDSEVEALAKQISASTAVDVLPNTLILEIRVHADAPEKARLWCEGMADSYVSLNFEAKQAINAAGAAAIKSEIQKTTDDLGLAEKRLMDYQAAHDVGGKEYIKKEEIGESTVAKIRAATRSIEAENKYRALKRWYETNEYTLPLPEDLAPSPLIKTLYRDIVEKRTDFKNLQSKYRERHPRVQEVKAHLQTLENNMDREIRASLSVLEKQASIYADIGDAHEGQLETDRRELQKEREREWQGRVLEREVDVKVEINRALLSKLGELNIADSIVRNNVRIIERAKALPFPVRPNWSFNMLVGLAFGFAVGFAGVFFLEYLDNTLKTPDDVARYLELPVLAIVPIAREEYLTSPYEGPKLIEGESGAPSA